MQTIALLGRPNVGKSTLFNRLTRSQKALVLDEPGVTRDRQCAEVQWNGQICSLIDAGGVHVLPHTAIERAVVAQAWEAVHVAHLVFLVVDGSVGITPCDRDIAQQLRKHKKEVIVVINKVENLHTQCLALEFHRLGFDSCFSISALQYLGIQDLMNYSFGLLYPEQVLFQKSEPSHQRVEKVTLKNKPYGNAPLENGQDLPISQQVPVVTVVGRPNVGKSTLVNGMLGEKRVIVCDHPGTTRESVYISMERMGQSYILVDTAGVRRKSSIKEKIEAYSVAKTMEAIKLANVVLFVLDAQKGITDQDLKLLGLVVKLGRACMILVNKWDDLPPAQRLEIKKQLNYRIPFADFASVCFISALHGTGVGDLFSQIDAIFQSAYQSVSSHQLTKMLEQALSTHPPALVQGRRVKLRYAHCGGRSPFTIVLHGNQTEALAQTYIRYLSKFFMKSLKLKGTPIRIVCKTTQNPYKEKR